MEFSNSKYFFLFEIIFKKSFVIKSCTNLLLISWLNSLYNYLPFIILFSVNSTHNEKVVLSLLLLSLFLFIVL